METIIVVAIIIAAAAYTARALYRGVSTGKKSCGCEGGCPISDRCNPADGQCVVNERREEVAN